MLICFRTSFFILDIYVVTRSEDDLSETVDGLKESLFRVLAAVTSLETYTKALRVSGEHTNHTKADC